ncbi:hypothetical protein Tco_0126523 [Tanacetum coccineum]
MISCCSKEHHVDSISEAWTRFKDLLQKSLIMASTFGSKSKFFMTMLIPSRDEPLTIRSVLEDQGISLNGQGIALPQDVPSTSDRCLIKLENQVQRLMEAHLAPTQPTQVNKITTSCEICSGPHDTRYCMEDLEQAFVEYASSRTDKAGCPPTMVQIPTVPSNNHPRSFHNLNKILMDLVSCFVASQDARLSKFEADFKQQQTTPMMRKKPNKSNSPTVSPFKDCTVHIPYTNAKTFVDDVIPNHVGDKDFKSIDGIGIKRMPKIKKDGNGMPKEPNKEWKLNEKVVLIIKKFITINGTRLKFPI